MRIFLHFLNQREILLYLVLSICLFSCSNDETQLGLKLTAPNVTTTEVTNISLYSASSGGTIVSNSESPITERGVCWGTNQNPTINDNKTSDGVGGDGYASKLRNLQPNTTYFLRAYAIQEDKTVYGNVLMFRTAPACLITKVRCEYLDNSDISYTMIYEYDDHKRLTKSFCYSDGIEQPRVISSYTYNDKGTISSIIYIDLEFTCTYDDDNRLNEMYYFDPWADLDPIRRLPFNYNSYGQLISGGEVYSDTITHNASSRLYQPSLIYDDKVNGMILWPQAAQWIELGKLDLQYFSDNNLISETDQLNKDTPAYTKKMYFTYYDTHYPESEMIYFNSGNNLVIKYSFFYTCN